MLKKELKRNRMINYFVEAAVDIIKEEGIPGITIRKIADKAGYNSATLYNYFENLDHLVFFAALHLIKPYTENVGEYMIKGKDALERNLLAWDFFLQHSFREPRLFEAIFLAHLHNPLTNYMEDYYRLYPSEVSSEYGEVSEMLSKQNIYERTYILLENCAEEGFFRKEDIDEIDEMIILIYKGMLTLFLADEGNPSPEEYISRTMKYIKVCHRGFLTNAELMD